MVYTWYILRIIHEVYTRNIHCIKLVYQSSVGIYMVYLWYIHAITWYMKCICRPDRYVRYKPSKYLMGLFCTFFYNDIPVIYYVYPLDSSSWFKLPGLMRPLPSRFEWSGMTRGRRHWCVGDGIRPAGEGIRRDARRRAWWRGPGAAHGGPRSTRRVTSRGRKYPFYPLISDV